MHWQATCLSLVLVVPAFAYSQSLQLTDRNVTLTACVQAGTHGSVSNLTRVQLIALESVPRDVHRVMVWFDKNLDGFKEHVGQVVEIRGNVNEVLAADPGLKASDGVFANADLPPTQVTASNPTVRAASTSGNATSQAVATDSKPPETNSEDEAPSIVRAEVVAIKMIGTCPRP